MATLNISLTPELVNLINGKVESGMYHSASEVVREGLRLLREQDEIRRIRLEELRREVAIGTEQIERGEGTIFESGQAFMDHIEKEGLRILAERKRS